MHNAAMPAITVRNVPDDTRNELAARAARSGRSLQEYLRAELIRLASTSTMEEWLQKVQADKEKYGVRLSAEEIVALVHEGRP
jgi:plasmid stability protein